LLLLLFLRHSSSTLIRRLPSLDSFCMQMIYARKCPGRRVGAKNWIRECQSRLISFFTQPPKPTTPPELFHPSKSQMSGHSRKKFAPHNSGGRLQFHNCPKRGSCGQVSGQWGFFKYLLNILLSPRGRGQAANHDPGLYQHLKR